MSKSILYYTDGRLDPPLMQKCQEQLLKAGLPIVSVSRKRIAFGDKRIVLLGLKPSPSTMYKQILLGLQECDYRFVFLCEHDVLYHPSHFDFIPPRDNTFFYNTNVYKVWQDGHIVWTDDLQQVSGLCANRLLLLEFYHRRLQDIERNGFDLHFEPGPRFGYEAENWQSAVPNIDIRHDKNLTKSHRQASEFRNPKYAKGFRVCESVPGWDEVIHGC